MNEIFNRAWFCRLAVSALGLAAAIAIGEGRGAICMAVVWAAWDIVRPFVAERE